MPRHVLVACTALLGAACTDEPSIGEPADAGAARVQVVNGTPNALTVLIDGAQAVGVLMPATISPALSAAPGARRVELRPLAGGAGSTTSLSTAAGDTALVAALGATAAALTAVALPDSGAVPAPGMTKVQVIHLAAKAPAIWVWRRQPDFPTPVRFQFPHPYGAATPYVQSTPGTWELFVTYEGGDPSIATLARLTLPVPANQARRVAVLDSLTGVGVRLVEIGSP